MKKGFGVSRRRPPRERALGEAAQDSAPMAVMGRTGNRPHKLLLGYLASHVQAAVDSLARLAAAPIQSLMTCLVIGVALALPSMLHVILSNVQQLSGRWERTAEMSLFLAPHLEEEHRQQLGERLRRHAAVRTVRLISPEEALEEFRSFSGFSAVIDDLGANPLPSVAVVGLGNPQLEREAAVALVREFEALPGVAQAQFDMGWLQRLNSMMHFGQRFFKALRVLLMLGVLLVICHTIRLAIQHRKEEIRVTQLVGGTSAYVRRPFLYTGLLYGGGGGLCAWFMVWLFVLWMRDAGQELALLYESNFTVLGLSAMDSGLLCLSGALVGLLGAWLGVVRYLAPTVVA